MKTVIMPTRRTCEGTKCCYWLFACICYNYSEEGLGGFRLDTLLQVFPHPHTESCVWSSQTFLRRGAESDSDSESSDG